MKSLHSNARVLSLLVLIFIFSSLSTFSLTDQEQFANVAERVIPSIVNIRTKTKVTQSVINPFDQFFYGDRNPREIEREGSSLGSGFVIDKEGLIITNNHVIQNATEIYVKFDNGKEYSAEIVGRDPQTDVAVIKIINTNDKFTPVDMGDSDKIKVGHWAIAIGNPFGLNSTMTLGIISATGRGSANLQGYADYIQTDASINPGNSGGPLIDIYGNVIGVNTAIISNSGGNIGLGFAIPINTVKRIANSIREYGEVKRPLLGVRFEPNFDSSMAKAMGLESSNGALIAEVIEDSPAEKAELKRRDVILAIDGKEIKNYAQAVAIIGTYQPGEKIKLTVYRKEGLGKGKKRSVTAILTARDGYLSTHKNSYFGMKLATLDNDAKEKYGYSKRQSGVVILEVNPNSQIARNGIKEGDLILEINNIEIKSFNEFKEIYDKAAPNSDILLYMVRDGYGGYHIMKKE